MTQYSNLTQATDNRMGCAEFTLLPNTSGPPPHWHIMVIPTQMANMQHMAWGVLANNEQ
jgi:hypothetical protein